MSDRAALELVRNLYADIQELQIRAYAEFIKVVDEVRQDRMPDSDMVDLGFLCREIAGLADDIRKEASAKQELAGRIIALRVAKRSLQGSTEDTVRGKLATGKPDVKVIPVLPKHGTPEYTELCAFFGVPPELVDSGAVSFSFTRLSELCAERMREGKEVPPGVRKTHTVAMTTFYKRSDRHHGEDL